jgi:type IV pilus assembly protein PilW
MKHSTRTHRMRGLSLIEILVALAIGSLLVLGLVEVFAASRTAYQLSTGLARVQENGRFAMDFLQRDLRMAGHLGCVNDQARFLPTNAGLRPPLASTFLATAGDYGSVVHPALAFDVAIRGHEATGTGPGNALALATTPAPAASADAWSPAINATIFADMVGAAGSAGAPVAGSDVVELRLFLPNGAQMTAFDPATGTLNYAAAQAPRLTDGAENPGLFGIADCMNAAVFQATTRSATAITVQAGGLNQAALTGSEAFVAGQARIHRAESVVYYVGLNNSGMPALYRLRYNATPAGALIPLREELVEGIESMQFKYGQDSRTDPAETPTGNIGSSRLANEVLPAADPVSAWRRVGMVQVGLLARSTEPAAATQRATDVEGVTALSALGLRLNPPNDTYYRAVYEDTIAVRNRLFGN